MYEAYSDEWIEGLDEPSVAVALFMKYMSAYRRCRDGPKNDNTWLMDVKGCLWLGAYKVCGKNSHVTESLYRMDTLYGKKMSVEELEWKRRNQSLRMTKDGPSFPLDKVNEFLNARNKGIVTSPDFETVCTQTSPVMLSRATAFDAFGCKNFKSKSPSTKKDIVKLMALFDWANIFPAEYMRRRVFEQNTFGIL